MNSTEKKRKVIINVIYIAMIIALIYLILTYALGICLPFVFAFLIAIILQKPKNFLIKKTPLKKGAASAILVLVALCVVVTLLSLIGAGVVNRVKEFISYITQTLSDWQTLLENVTNWLTGITDKLPKALAESFNGTITALHDRITEYFTAENASTVVQKADEVSKTGGLSSLLGGFSLSSLSSPISSIASAVSKIPSVLISIVISIVACCFMTSDYDKIKAFFIRQFPQHKQSDLSRAKVLLKDSLGKMLKAYGCIMAITFAEVALGLYILKWLGIFDSSFIFIIALVTCIVDIIPVLGTGTIVLPWAVYSLIMSNYKMAIGLIIMYAVITVIRQVIEPKFVAGQLGLSPVVTIISLYFGLKIFGVLGMIATPILVIMLKLLNDEGIIHLWTSAAADELTEETQIEPTKKPKEKKKKAKTKK